MPDCNVWAASETRVCWYEQDNAAPNTSPTINQEVVATLLEVLLTHDDANAALETALAHRGDAPTRDLANSDLSASIASAALLESRLTAVEWTQIALLALNGTQVRLSSALLFPAGLQPHLMCSAGQYR